MKHKVVLFDADGVTIDHSTLFSEELARDYGIGLETTGSFFQGPFQDCMVGKADLKEELGKVIGAWGWKGSVDDLVDYWFSGSETFDQRILGLVADLRAQGVHCYLATNQERYRGEHLRRKLKDAFEDVFVSADLGHKKNELEFFQAVFDRLGGLAGEDKSAVLLIDDDERNVSAARAFGIDAMLYRTFEDVEARSEFSELLRTRPREQGR